MSAIVGTPPCASITPGRGLDPFFSPRTVALIGATESPGSVGRTLMENLLAFEGQIFPVNPRRATVLGRSAYPNVAAIAEPWTWQQWQLPQRRCRTLFATVPARKSGPP